MTFSGLTFLFYFLPLALGVYYLFFFSKPMKNFILLAGSLAFYAWGEPRNFFLLILSIVVNYLMGLWIAAARKHKMLARTGLTMVLLFNLGMLFVFKYFSFFVEVFTAGTGVSLAFQNLALPIGISFFTFQAISFDVDIYRGDVPMQKNLLHVALYLSFFPKLTQGPVMKYKSFEPQILNRRETWQKFSAGCCSFIVGLGKKVLLANNMAVVADRIFEIQKMGDIPVSLAWLGALAYTFQIYFDFSGYSDMATGLGLMFGFKLDKNFDYPYISRSISEFWRRWHITLGRWFVDYLYIPLGGSRVKSKDVVARNLAIVWIATGIWHGANWTFLIWGVLNFICIILERAFQFEKSRIPQAVRHIYSMFVVIIGWVIFRSDNLTEAGHYILCLFNFLGNGFASDYTGMFLKEYGVFFLFAVLFSLPLAQKLNTFMAKGILLRSRRQNDSPHLWHKLYAAPPLNTVINMLYPVGMMLLFAVCTAYLVKGSYNPFIYFQF